MKKQLMIAVAAIAAATAVTTTANADNYNVTANIKGLADGTQLVLVPMSHDNEKPIAEATVQGGKVVFAGSVAEPICANIRVKDCYGSMQVMLGNNETLSITATATESKAWDGTPNYSYNDKKVSGSPLTDKLLSFVAVRDTLNEIRAVFEDKYKDLFGKQGAAIKTKDSVALAKISASDEYKQMVKDDAAFFKRVEESYARIINANKDNFWGPLLLVNLTSYLTPDQRPTYDSFSEAAKNSYYGKKVKDELYPAGSVGQKVPDFTTKDDNGKEYTLQSLLQGKKYLIIDFWASWCVPCRKEIPNVKKQYELYKDKGLQVVSISIDKSLDAWRKAVKAEDLQWPNFCDREVSDIYKVKAVPTMYLIDSEGKIIAEGDQARGANLASKLAELFK